MLIRKRIICLVVTALVMLITIIIFVMVTRKISRPTAESIFEKENVNVSTKVLNLIHPKVCIELWRDDLMTMEDTLHCIDWYMESKKQ
jgi:hypothetical protein